MNKGKTMHNTVLALAAATGIVACAGATENAAACDPGWSYFYQYNASTMYAAQQYQDQVYRGGWFTLSRWTGSSWEIFGGGIHGSPFEEIYAAAMVKLELPSAATAPEKVLVVGGKFPYAGAALVNNITIWDNVEFQPLGGGMNNPVEALCVYHDQLIAGGQFSHAGGVAASRIARWDGEQWHPLAGGVYDIIPNQADGVKDMVVYHDDLYVVGDFTHADGTLVNYIARWDGHWWYDVGGGVELVGYDFTGLRGITVHEDKLVIVGAFDYSGGVPALNVAAWDGTTWSALGAGGDPYDPVFGWRQALTAVGSYNGLLYGGGDFTNTAGPNAEALAVWDGNTWSEVDGGVSGGSFVLTLMADFSPHLEDGVESMLLAGDFDHAGGGLTDSIAMWTTCPLYGDVNMDGVVDIDDLFAVLAAWGPCEVCTEDVNDDYMIDIDDLFEVLANWT